MMSIETSGDSRNGGSQNRRYNERRTPPRLVVVFDRYKHPLYFVTFCTARRRQLLANPQVHEVFRVFTERGHRERGVAVGRYILMPDHVHLFVAGNEAFDLAQWVRMLKMTLGKAIAKQGHEPEFWQRGFFDHLLRSEESCAKKWEYVRQNPVRAGLVKVPKEWLYQGEGTLIECR